MSDNPELLSQDMLRWRVHAAKSDNDPARGEHCAICGQRIRSVPGGSGPVLVHSDSGTVAAPTPAIYQAQMIHEERQRIDPEHDRGGCWCCCQDCDWDHEAVTAGRLERGEGW